jgi:bacterioferritin-associated ferredoxin
MIVCSCNLITDKELAETVGRLVAADALTVLTPLRLFHALGRRPRCGGCLTLVVELMHARAETMRDR